MGDFAVAIQRIRKIVFSRTLKSLTWENSALAKGSLEEEVKAVKKEPPVVVKARESYKEVAAKEGGG